MNLSSQTGKATSYQSTRSLSENEHKIISLLKDNTMALEQIGVQMEIEQLEFMELLGILELEGVIQPLPGGRWMLGRGDDQYNENINNSI